MVDVEKRRYKIIGFRDLEDGHVRVIIKNDAVVKNKEKTIGLTNVMSDPLGVASQLMQSHMNQMVHDTFLISYQEYMSRRFVVGESILVTIEKIK